MPQSFPPKTSGQQSWPDRLAVSPNGRTLLVPLNLADAAAVIDTHSRSVRYVKTGAYPYGAAILKDGKTGLVSNEGPGTVSVISLASATKRKDIQVAGNLSHPEGITVDPHRPRAYVAIANVDQVAMIDTHAMRVAKVMSVERSQGPGESPVAVAVTPDGRRLFAAESAADELAVFSLPSGTPIGRIPTLAYPADVQATKGRLLWVAAKGLGAGPNRNGPNPYTTNDNNLLLHPGSAVLSSGRAGVLSMPTNAQIRRDTQLANRQVIPANAQRAPSGTPLRAGGPIKHVFFFIRENRTYDQVLGDDHRGDGAPSLTLFGQGVTPNMHALVRRFPLLDHVYANSEASIDGHFWTSAAAVSDYVQKNWEQNYAGRGRPYDFGAYTITWPGTGFLFDRAQHQGISYANYGEVVAGTIPPSVLKIVGVVDKDAGRSQAALETQKYAHSKVGYPFDCYPNDLSIGTDSIAASLAHKHLETFDSSVPAGAAADSESRFSCFKKYFDAQVASGKVPAFNYLVLLSDHTNGVSPGARTPRSMVAENDYGLGQFVDLISHSSDLALVGDLRARGRFAGRRRSRRRPPHAGRCLQSLRQAGRRHPYALRHALDDPFDRADPRDEAARAARPRRDPDVRRVPVDPVERGAVQRGRADLSAASAQRQHGGEPRAHPRPGLRPSRPGHAGRLRPGPLVLGPRSWVAAAASWPAGDGRAVGGVGGRSVGAAGGARRRAAGATKTHESAAGTTTTQVSGGG